ncbi:MAG: PIG-L family deacetylase [Desulfosoma sp.]
MMDRAFEAELYPIEAAPLPSARQALVFAAHADDEVYGCGGTLRLLSEKGTPVSVVVVTQGNQCRGDVSEEIVERRRRESFEASRLLGYAAPKHWDIPDRELRYTENLVCRLHHIITSLDADLVFAPALSEMHPDHQALALAVGEAVRRSGGSRLLAFYEVSAPTTPNTLIDISPVVDVKKRAMQCFISQEAIHPYHERILALNRYRAYVLGKNAEAAEAFLMVDSSRLEHGLARVCETWLSRRRTRGLAVEPADLPLVSVIVRSTGRRELSEALESIANQTYPNLEVVLVDALGSLASHENHYAGRLLLKTVSTGQSLSRSRAANLGLQEASGRYVLFLDEDDLLLPDHVWRLVKALQARREAKAAYAGVRAVDETGTTIVEYDLSWSVDRMLAANFIPIMAVLFERALFEDGCRFDEDFEVSEDWDFWMQISQHTPLVHVPGVSAIYRYYLGESKLSRDRDHNFYLYWRKKVLEKWFRALGVEPFAAALYRLAQELDQLGREKGAFKRELEELQRVREDLLRHNAALKQELDETRADLAAQVLHNQEVLRENNELRHQLAAFEREREILLNSTVWRLTAPVRFLAGVLKRARRRIHEMIS